MRCLSILVIAGLCLLAPRAYASRYVGHAENGAFLAWHVQTTTALVRQFDRSAAVRDRYERHFGHSRHYLRGWFKSLHLKRLTEDAVYDVYNVHRDGMVRMRNVHLKKGMWVFVDSSGTPILKLSCGNPLYPGSDRPPPVSLAPTVSAPAPVDVQPSLAPAAPELSVNVESPPPTVTSTVTEVATKPTTPTPETTEVPVITDVAAPVAAVPVSFGSGIPGGLLGFIPIVFGGHGRGGGTTGGGGGGGHHHPPVPEPNAMPLLAVGAVAVAMRQRRSRSAPKCRP